MHRRLLHFANNAISVEYDGEIPTHLIDFLFHYIPETGSATPHLTYRLTMDEVDNKLVLYRGDERETDYQSEASMAIHLMERACYHLADKSQGGLMLHAAAALWNNEGVLLPGTTRSGKSTLTAWLCSQGFDYMTDELSFIPQDTKEIYAFTRPLNLKKDVRPLFRELIAATRQSESLLRTFNIDLFSPRGLTAGGVINHAPLHRIIFPQFQSDASFNLQKLSKAHSSLALMRCLVNARNLPEHGLPEIIRISQTIPAYAMIYGSFEQIEQAFEGIL